MEVKQVLLDVGQKDPEQTILQCNYAMRDGQLKKRILKYFANKKKSNSGVPIQHTEQ